MHWSINLNYQLQLILNMGKSWVNLIIRQKIYWYFRPGCSKQTEINKMTFGQKFNLGISGKQNFRIFLSNCQKYFYRADHALKVWSSVSHPSHTIYLVKIASSSFKIVVNRSVSDHYQGEGGVNNKTTEKE